MSERETFGPRLRAERERRGISLDTLASVTKVSADLWEGLERNDFSRWPSGIFARAFVRDYARAVGLDADEIVDEGVVAHRGRDHAGGDGGLELPFDLVDLLFAHPS